MLKQLPSFVLFTGVVLLTHTIFPANAIADAEGVGLGVAAGVAHSPTKLDVDVGSGFAWGFFVDIPLLSTFYISPAAMLYEMDLGNGKKPATDIDLNFKFIIPISALSIGAGVTAGVTNAEERYSGHYGLLGYLAYSLVPNFDIFAMVQYKRLARSAGEVDNIHSFLGGMFRF